MVVCCALRGHFGSSGELCALARPSLVAAMDPCFWRTAGTLGRLYKRASPALPVVVRARFAELLLECRVHFLACRVAVHTAVIGWLQACGAGCGAAPHPAGQPR